MTDDMKIARERARKRAAEREHNAYMMDRYHTLDKIKKEAEDKTNKEKAEKEAAMKRRVAERLAHEARPHKLFVCGDVRGNFEKLFPTLQAQAAKIGGMEAVLCVGRTLPEAESAEGSMLAYLKGEKKVPFQTYFIDSSPALLQAAALGREMAENLYFLGGYGIKTICGLRVAFLSGHYDAAKYETAGADFVGGAFTARAVNNLKKQVLEDTWKRGIDILLTCGWPAGLAQKVEAAARPASLADGPSWEGACAPPIAELCLALEPRYHICGTADLFYQRPPFKAPRREHACRCIALGQVGSTSKQRKWLHALSLSPMDTMKKEDLKQLPEGTTPCPFVQDVSAQKRAAPEEPSGEPAAKRIAGEVAKDKAAGEEALTALLAGEVAKYQGMLTKLQDSEVWVGNANIELERKTQVKIFGDDGNAKHDAQKANDAGAGAASPQDDDGEEDLTEEGRAARQAAQDNLGKPPAKGIVRYTFRDEGLLGLRLSRDVPPWVLEVREGTLAGRKVPRVPVGGVVVAINGFDISKKENPMAMKGLAKRPVVLDIDWPIDQPLPAVSSA
eukprot:TRINITY_DN32688_c0_g1_i1.p1 TRINITY_DN32688_c0_g1~~TRINITY_DN32688_c0_g1_i1.p1  ORF type:complete len:560 (+),score=140.11 TRINITY_DN32688_c0_g1_i1:71-1750(+)